MWLLLPCNLLVWVPFLVALRTQKIEVIQVFVAHANIRFVVSVKTTPQLLAAVTAAPSPIQVEELPFCFPFGTFKVS